MDDQSHPRPRPRLIRPIVTALVVATTIVGAVLFWRATTLVGLPDIGPPFDLAQSSTIDLADDANAYSFYRRALGRFRRKLSGVMQASYPVWAAVTAPELEHLANNRESMALWLEGTKRDRGLHLQPGRMSFDTIVETSQELRSFGRLANLESCRLMEEGDLAGAWTWLRANLRASRHCGQHGTIVERLIGAGVFLSTSPAAIRWAEDSRVDAPMLRSALDDLIALDALTAPTSDAVRCEYFVVANTLDDPERRVRMAAFLSDPGRSGRPPGWRDRAREIAALLLREPERSRRMARLVIANLLTGCDLPASERARRLTSGGKLALFDPVPGETTPFAPADLERWIESTAYARLMLDSLAPFFRSVAREESTRAKLIVRFAEEIHRREHGHPPGAVETLVGPILKAVPVGYIRPVDPNTFVGPLLP